MSDTDVRTLSLLLAVWLGVSIAVFVIGVGVETMLWPSVGEPIQLVGLVLSIPSASLIADIMIALPRRRRYVLFSVIGAVVAVTAGWLYRNAPESFDSLMQGAALVGGMLGAVVVLMLGRVALEKIGVFPRGET